MKLLFSVWTLLFCLALSASAIDTAFTPDMEGWQMLRISYNKEKEQVEFRPGDGGYFHLKRSIPAQIQAGSRVRITLQAGIDDPQGNAAAQAQLRLIFHDAAGKTIFSSGESGKGTTLHNTNGEKCEFTCDYTAPVNVSSVEILVKSHAPLYMNLWAIRVTVTPPPDSRGFPFIIRSIQPGSVADYSFLNHKPAGKYGWLKVKNGDFVFQNGETVRWFGINLVASRAFDLNTHEEIDALAAKLAALGINMVRLHHLAASWQRAEPLFADEKKSTFEFSDEALEKLDYLTFALKKQGIYVTDEIIDSSLNPADGEIPYARATRNGHSLKLLMMFDPEVKAYVRRWVQAFYCRPNRYTGIPLIRDPQLAMLGITNEVSIAYHNGNMLRSLPENARALLDLQFQAERSTAKLPPKPFDFSLQDPDSARYLHRLLQKAFAEWKEFVRSLGYGGLVSGSNFGENFYHHTASAGLDFMDAHLYWGYAGYMDGVDSKIRILPGNRWSDLVKPPYDEGNYTKELFARFSLSSTPDHPLISSEHRTSISDFQRSEYRSAGLPFFSTIQAFQEWDGFYVFASQGDNTDRIGHRLDVKYDTAYLATFPLCAYLLRGGVVKPARETIFYSISDQDIFQHPLSPGFNHDGLFSVPERHKIRLIYPASVTGRPASRVPGATPFTEARTLPHIEKDEIGGDTGEFVRNWKKGTFRIMTSKVQGAEGFFEQNEQFDLPDCVFQMESPFGVCFLSAGNADSIRSAPRILLTAVNASINTGNLSVGSKGWGLPGSAPARALPVKGILRMKANRYDIWILDENGMRRERAAVNTSSFQFDTGRDKTVWYELERR